MVGTPQGFPKGRCSTERGLLIKKFPESDAESQLFTVRNLARGGIAHRAQELMRVWSWDLNPGLTSAWAWCGEVKGLRV